MNAHLITSAFRIFNGIKHLALILWAANLPLRTLCRLSARARHEVLFPVPRMKHGTPAELGRGQGGKPVAEYCAEMHEVQARIATGRLFIPITFGPSSSTQKQGADRQFRRSPVWTKALIEEVEQRQDSIRNRRAFYFSLGGPGGGNPPRYVDRHLPNCALKDARGGPV